MRVVVHGGAGTAPDDPGPRQAIVDAAAAAGAEAGTPVDAVEAAVRRLESSPRFNAGVGGAVQSDGTIRTDAGMMTGARDAGAACAMPGVEHAVSVARAVMAETPHVLVAGEHAVELADTFGIGTGVDLWTDRTRERWEGRSPPDGGVDEQLRWVRGEFGGADTVGAVAADGDELAAATSTGGRWFALAGRVGDVPQIGNGFYASPMGAASATGAGEDIARSTLARRTVRHVERGADAATAAERAIEEFVGLTGSTAGVIAIDRERRVGAAFDSDAMQTAVARD